MDVKSTWIPTWHQMGNGSCFMVTGSIFENHLLEVGLTKDQEIMALQMLTTVDLFYSFMCEDLTWIDIHWNSIWSRTPVTYDFTLRLRARDHTTWCWRCVKTAFGHFLLDFHIFMVTTLGSCVKWPLFSSVRLFMWAPRI